MRWPEAKCTKPSHSQLLANFVENVHSQGISAAKTKVSPFHSQKHSHSLANSFAALHSQLFCLRFGAYNSLANLRGASEFVFIFAAVWLRPRCTQGPRRATSLGPKPFFFLFTFSVRKRKTACPPNKRHLCLLSQCLRWFLPNLFFAPPFLSLSLSLSLSLPLSPLSLYIYIYLSRSLSISLYIYIYISLSLSLSLSFFSFFLFPFLVFFLSFFHSLCSLAFW